MQDVEDYWEKSFGQTLNYEMACVLAKDVVDSLDKDKIRFLFGHAETIMPLVSFLGFFRDDAHLVGNTELELKQRKWKTSVVSPFAANLQFVVRTCGADEQKFVEIRHNEIALDLSHLCPSSSSAGSDDRGFISHCTFGDFKRALRERIGACDFEQMCKPV